MIILRILNLVDVLTGMAFLILMNIWLNKTIPGKERRRILKVTFPFVWNDKIDEDVFDDYC